MHGDPSQRSASVAEPSGTTQLGPLARAKRWVRPVFALLAAGFVVLVAKDMIARFSGVKVAITWPWLLVAVVPGVVSLLCQYQGWWVLVSRWTGHAMPRLLALRVYVDAQLARYTPGKVGLVAVRVARAQSLGMSAQLMVSTLLAEVLVWVACGTFLSGLLIISQAKVVGTSQALTVASQFLGYLGAAACAGLLLLLVLPNRFWPRRVVEVLGARQDGPLMPAVVPGWLLLHFVCSSLGGACLVLGLGGTWAQGIYLGAVVCVATVAGFLALLAPAGLGVREAMIAVFAEPLLGAETAVALGLSARAVSLLSEVLLFAALRLVKRRPVIVDERDRPQ